MGFPKKLILSKMEEPPVISFRKISSPEAFKKFLEFLKQDVIANGGSASETVNMHGQLWDITFSHSPWGPILIRKEVTRLEALIILFESWDKNSEVLV